MPSTSTKDFAYKVGEAHNIGNTTALLDAFDEYQSSHCYFPQRLSLVSAHDCIPSIREIDCGKCYHCRETKINSWVTRMYAHCEDFPFVYFVTLTYRPFYKLGDVSSLVLKKLNGALFHRDNFNSNNRLGYNPCVLCKRHYQTFLKRLRKNTNNNSLTYMISGEYGKSYGRPHYHMILFSKSPICLVDVKRAWSIGVWRSDSGEWSFLKNQRKNGKAYYFCIGDVDFHDLVTNGSFNESEFVVDGDMMNARNCFAYVCKYVCKGDKQNNNRIQLAYHSLFSKQFIKRKMYGDFYEENMKLNRHDRVELQINKNFKMFIKNKPTDYVTYYETSYDVGKNLYTDDLPLYDSDEKPIYSSDYLTFLSDFSQFVEVSRGCPLGSLYAKSHVSEFVDGIFPRPLLQNKGFIVPSYFRRKAEEYVYGLRLVHKTISGKSLNFSPLPLLLRHFEDVLKNGVPFNYRVSTDLFRSVDAYIKNGRNCFKDLSTGEYVLFPYNGRTIKACYFKYNRLKREYYLTRITPLNAFLASYLPKLKLSIERFENAKKLGQQNAKYLEQAALMLEEYGYNLYNLRTKFKHKQDDYLNFRNKTYDITHAACE